MTIMQITEQSKPWHKYPLVWMMIAIPFSAVIMGVVMIWLAVDTDDGLVVDDYYKHGLEINMDISRDTKASDLDLSATIEFSNDVSSEEAKMFKVKFNKGLLDNYPDTLQLNLQHATHENSDVAIVLNHGIDNQYIGYTNEPISDGVWYFEITNKIWLLKVRSYVRAHNVIELQNFHEMDKLSKEK
jgi:hypothetical protein